MERVIAYRCLDFREDCRSVPTALCWFSRDGGYEGKDFAQKIKDEHHLDLEVVKRKLFKGLASTTERDG